MSNARTPILVGVASPLLEILVLSKMAKFPFQSMDYRPWGSKNLIDQNRLKKFVQVEIDVTCMHTNFGGRSLSTFGDIGTFKTVNFPFRGMDYSPWSSKNLIDWNRLKKFMQVEIDVTCMHTNFGGRSLSAFGYMDTFQKRPIFPFGAWTIVHGHRKI